MKSNKQREPVSYPVHPAANLFPMMTEEEYQGLKADIAEHGQRRSIVIWNGQLIDGRHRLRACNELRIKPRVEELESSVDPIAWVVSENLHRRHLNTSQRASVAARLATVKRGEVGNGREVDRRIRLSTSEVSEMLNVSETSIKQAKYVIEHGSDEVIAAVDKGTLTLNAAVKRIKQLRTKSEVMPIDECEVQSTVERDKVTKLMQFVRAELQRLNIDERTEATIRILEEMGLPKQTEEQFRAELDRANEPAYIKKIRAEHAKKGAAIKAKYSARMRKMDENWPGFDAQRGEADE